MRTIKLNKQISSNKRHNITSRNKMIRGSGAKHSLETKSNSVDFSQRQSKRGKPTIIIPVRTLGTGQPTTSGYGHQELDEDTIREFVNNTIGSGPQVVSLPTPPESHSIFVNVDENNNVMISDWGGKKNRMLGINPPIQTSKKGKKGKKGNKSKDFVEELKLYNQFRQYSILINCLEEKYNNVSYYPVDHTIYDIANIKHNACNGQGGCSTYMHLWIDKHYSPNAVLYLDR